MGKHKLTKEQQKNISWTLAEKYCEEIARTFDDMDLKGEIAQNVLVDLIASLGFMTVSRYSEYTHEAIDLSTLMSSRLHSTVSHLLLERYENESGDENDGD